MYCEIVYFIEENNCEKRHADLKPRGYNCFWIDPYLEIQRAIKQHGVVTLIVVGSGLC